MGITSIVKENCICLTDRDDTILRITETLKNEEAEITLEGDLRSDTALVLGDELKILALLDRNLSVNLQKVNGLSTSCCRAFLSVQQMIDNNEKGSLKLVKIPAPILEKMAATGLTSLLQIEK